MNKETEAGMLITGIHRVAETFIKQHYPEEGRSFAAAWQAFDEWVKQWKGPEAEKKASEALLACVQTGLGFAEEGLDKISRIVLATVAKLLCEMQGQRVSLFGIERLVSKTAAGTGASGELLATMVRHLPRFCMEARSANLEATEAHVSRAVMPQYEIWTEGERRIVDSIGDYEKKKKNYLLWIDLDEKVHRPTIRATETIGTEAISLLCCLVKRLGARVSLEEVLKEVWGEEVRKKVELRDAQVGKLEQQLTSLQKFCGGEFRKYLFGEKLKKGLGLDRSFSKKYFMFSRLR